MCGRQTIEPYVLYLLKFSYSLEFTLIIKIRKMSLRNSLIIFKVSLLWNELQK